MGGAEVEGVVCRTQRSLCFTPVASASISAVCQPNWRRMVDRRRSSLSAGVSTASLSVGAEATDSGTEKEEEEEEEEEGGGERICLVVR